MKLFTVGAGLRYQSGERVASLEPFQKNSLNVQQAKFAERAHFVCELNAKAHQSEHWQRQARHFWPTKWLLPTITADWIKFRIKLACLALTKLWFAQEPKSVKLGRVELFAGDKHVEGDDDGHDGLGEDASRKPTMLLTHTDSFNGAQLSQVSGSKLETKVDL